MPQPSDLRVLLDPLSKSRPGPAGQAQVLASVFDGSLRRPVGDDVPPPVHQRQDDQAGEQVNKSEISNVHEVLPKGADFLTACPPPATPAVASLAAPVTARQGAGTLEEYEAWLDSNRHRLVARASELLAHIPLSDDALHYEYDQVMSDLRSFTRARVTLCVFKQGDAA